jgi:hypothetical protein
VNRLRASRSLTVRVLCSPFLKLLVQARGVSDEHADVKVISSQSLPGRWLAACKVVDDLATESSVRGMMLPPLADAVLARKDRQWQLDDELRFLFEEFSPCYMSAMVVEFNRNNDSAELAALQKFLCAMAGACLR